MFLIKVEEYKGIMVMHFSVVVVMVRIMIVLEDADNVVTYVYLDNVYEK